MAACKSNFFLICEVVTKTACKCFIYFLILSRLSAKSENSWLDKGPEGNAVSLLRFSHTVNATIHWWWYTFMSSSKQRACRYSVQMTVVDVLKDIVWCGWCWQSKLELISYLYFFLPIVLCCHAGFEASLIHISIFIATIGLILRVHWLVKYSGLLACSYFPFPVWDTLYQMAWPNS